MSSRRLLISIGAFFVIIAGVMIFGHEVRKTAREVAKTAETVGSAAKVTECVVDKSSVLVEKAGNEADTLMRGGVAFSQNVKEITGSVGNLTAFYDENKADFSKVTASAAQLSESGRGLLASIKEGKGATEKGKELWRRTKESPAKAALTRLGKAAKDRNINWDAAEQEYRKTKADSTWNHRDIPDWFWGVMKRKE